MLRDQQKPRGEPSEAFSSVGVLVWWCVGGVLVCCVVLWCGVLWCVVLWCCAVLCGVVWCWVGVGEGGGERRERVREGERGLGDRWVGG